MGGGKKTYKVVHVLAPDKIILADKRAFGKNKVVYERFHADLKKDWSQRHSVPATKRKTEFTSGEHVLVKSQRLEAPRRGIVLDNEGMVTSTGEPTYSVYVYDEGDVESIEKTRIMSLDESHKQKLEPRTVIVNLIGLVPAKFVVDHAKMALGDTSVPLILTQDHQWSTKAKRLTAEWLSHRNIKSIRILKRKTNEDGSVLGDIYRKFHTVFQDACSETPLEARDEETYKKKNKEYLSHYLCNEKLALFNQTLAESQSKLRDTLKETEARKKRGKEERNDESEAVKEDNNSATDYDESVLEETRMRLDSGCSSPDPSYLPQSRKPVPVRVTHPDDTGGAIVVPSLSVENGNYDYDESVLNETRHSWNDFEDSNTSDNLSKRPLSSKQNSITGSNAIQVPSYSGGSDNDSSSSAYLRRVKCNLVDTRTDAGNAINIPGRLLVRGKMVKPAYVRKEEYGLNKAIMRALEANGFADLSDVHKIVAPNFLRGSDIIVISPDGGKLAGKNCRVLTYILSILRLIYDKITSPGNLGKIDEKAAPEAVLIVNSHNTGKSVESFIQSLLNFCQDVPLKVKFICKDTATDTSQKQRKGKYEKNMIPGGISILITTMTYLEACMQTKDGPFLFKRLRFLIFEEVELYLKGYSEDMLTFINAARENMRICFEGLPFQIVFSGNKWSPEIEDLYKEMVKDRAPMVFISATNQVLHYARIKWKVHYVQEESKKLEQLTELLKTCLEEHIRLVVACSTPSVAQVVFEHLKSRLCQSASVLISTTHTDQVSQQDNMHTWRKNSPSVFIISDDMIRIGEVMNATCLVCFDSPELRIQGNVKRSIAAERFAYMWSNIRHIESEQPEYLEHKPEKVVDGTDLVTHFLMTGEEHNFYAMYKFAKSLSEGVEFPSELEELALMAERDGLLNVTMCQGTRIFGFCNHSDPANCPSRHFFTRQELQQPTCAPFFGEIEFRVIKCDNPSSYQVQLMRHYEFENKKRVCKRTYLHESRRRKSELKKYYENSDPAPLSVFKEGTWCVVRIKQVDEQCSYARAQVERIMQRDKHDVPRVVRVHCVDSGHILNPSVDQMFEITPEFMEWMPLVINLILCNLKPSRMENEYRILSEKKARSMTTDKIYNAKIWLSIGNTVWVNPMVEYHIDPETKVPYRGDSIRLALIYDKIAEFNKNHLQVLMELVSKYPGVYQGTLPNWATGGSQHFDGSLGSDELEMAKTEFHQISDEIQWAFVRKSGMTKFDPVRIVTQYGYDPWMFFGIQDKFYDQLKKLEKELDTCVNNYIKGSEEDDQRFTDYKSMFRNYYEIGMVVAAKERVDQVWMRALIVNKNENEDVEGGDENQVEFEVFFVDYGDCCKDMKMEELFPMPRTFVSRMPFQVIAFKLDHIRPRDGGDTWTSDESDAFLDLVVKDGLSIDVDVVAYEDTEANFSEVEIPCRYYNAFAFYHQKDLGAQFVENGLAAWTPGKEDLPKKVGDGLLKHYNAAVNQALESEDEPMEEESGAFGMANQGLEYDCYVNGNDVFDFFGVKPDEHMPKLPDIHVCSPVKEIEDSNSQPSTQAVPTTKPKNTPTKSMTEVDGASLLVPNVTWHQTESLLILKIDIPDINQYELNVVDKNIIQFRTLKVKPKDYGFTIKAYGKLEPQFGVNLTGLCMSVKFKKKMGGIMWSRLLYSREEKFHWLKEDLDYLTEEVEEVEMRAPQNTLDDSVLQAIQKMNMKGDKDPYDDEFDDEEDVLGLGSSYGVDLDEFSDSE